jgi:hypothetical protein
MAIENLILNFAQKKVTSEIAPLLLQCTLSEPTQCGERERERAGAREARRQ